MLTVFKGRLPLGAAEAVGRGGLAAEEGGDGAAREE
jgi:hypothetical protein